MKPLEDILQALFTEPGIKSCLTDARTIPARPARTRPFPDGIEPGLAEALRSRGIESLYTHQRTAFERLAEGKHVVVVTPTASGKTLCYNLSVFDTLLKDKEACALYLFPTKALAQDQLAEIRTVAEALGPGPWAFTYDGDTPGDARRAVRDRARIVITNPDMLHAGVLPHHTKWARLFRSLRYVVIDEIHQYRGVFGSHVANVVRRLKRICRFYGTDPRFVCCSATIANPAELAGRIVEEDVALVDDNGAPSGERRFYLYNPPVVDPGLGIRSPYLREARKLTGPFVEAGIQTIVFATSRLNVEVLVRELKERHASRPDLCERIRGYRGGYLPLRRREIEQGLRDGSVSTVVSTSALELGIDIGRLDVCIIAGYPGSIAGTWQRSGRAGRREGTSATVLVSRSEPLDQFIVGHPDYFFGQSPEHGRVNPDNLMILVSHVKCAAFELPFEPGERFGGEPLEEILEHLQSHGVVQLSGGKWHWIADSYPADGVSIRSAGPENFTVIERVSSPALRAGEGADEERSAAGGSDRGIGDGPPRGGGRARVIGEVDQTAAPSTLYPHAIYLCEGSAYSVEELDYSGRRAFVQAVDTDYYTEAITYSGVRVLEVFEQEGTGPVQRLHGEVHVSETVAGFKKIKFATRENVGYGEVALPDQELHTTAYWCTFSQELFDSLPFDRSAQIDGVLSIANVIRHLGSFFLMCDVHDLRQSVGDRNAEWFVRPAHGGRGRYTLAGLDGERDRLQVGPGAPAEGRTAVAGRAEGLRVETFEPAIFLYDAYPGGVGFSPLLYDMHGELLARAAEAIERCPCRAGCPSCVGASGEAGREGKAAALAILKRIKIS